VLIAANRGDAKMAEEAWTVSEPSIFGWIRIPAAWKLGWGSTALGFVMDRWAMIWAALAYVSTKVRGLLVQYIGDVAAYVTPNVLDRFDTIRDRIKACVFNTANAIYRAGDAAGQPRYGSVVLVGHSLGSVLVYDCLNRLLNEDSRSGGVLRVQERTKGLVTFGSPLDKTAFIFETNVDKPAANRAAMAATVQPLIADPRTRTIPWTNVYSTLDIISGSLHFYDEPGKEPNRVDNVPDYAVTLPAGAHNEYWRTGAVWERVNGLIPRPQPETEVLPPGAGNATGWPLIIPLKPGTTRITIS
jgi:pimeloyl-ACP methyl ester carboxylesterase